MIERRTPLKRSPLPRRSVRLARTGAKARRERPALDAFADALQTRSRGQCEASGLVDLTGQRVCGRVGAHPGTDPHHLWPEDRDLGMHVPSRGLWLCRAAHDWAHVVAPAAESTALGLLRPRQCFITVRTGYVPTDEQAVAAAALIYEDDPTVQSIVIEHPLGRLVVPPPGTAVEWRA